MEHIQACNIVNDSQHGFMPRRSCATNLLCYLEKVTSIIDEGHPVDVVYLDLSKAFDKVPHQRLLKVLEHYGIRGKLLNWIREWLAGRRQRVILNGSNSEWRPVISGVPQGSVLGPLLFLLYINILDPYVIHLIEIISKFADDTKVGNRITSPEDRNKLQSAINNLCNWAEKWQMKFNEDKCKVIHMGRSNPRYDYEMNGLLLQSSNCEKDVGVYVSLLYFRPLSPSPLTR